MDAATIIDQVSDRPCQCGRRVVLRHNPCLVPTGPIITSTHVDPTRDARVTFHLCPIRCTVCRHDHHIAIQNAEPLDRPRPVRA
jgi:hypothetical protein